MISTKIIGRASFLKMPVSSQCLYFHLVARADDDGIVEGATSKTSAAPNAAIAVVPSQKERILDALRKNASISISDAIRILGVQERQAQRILKSLIEEGSAVKIGAARATRYAEAKKRTELHE